MEACGDPFLLTKDDLYMYLITQNNYDVKNTSVKGNTERQKFVAKK